MPLLFCAFMLSACHVMVESKNASTVAFSNGGSSENSEALKWAKLLLESSNSNFYVFARYAAKTLCTVADYLSRTWFQSDFLFTSTVLLGSPVLESLLLGRYFLVS